MTSKRVLVVLFALLLAPGATALAQDSAQLVPRELALALLGGYGPDADRAEILVGRVPDGFPAEMLPADAPVLGGVVYPRRSTVVARVSGAPEAALSAVRERLRRAGWTEAADRDRPGGFVPAALARPIAFCRAEQQAFLSPVGDDGLLRIHLSRLDRAGGCDEGMGHRPPGMSEAPLPALVAPAGAHARGTSSGGGSDHWESAVRLETEAAPAPLLEHYTAQLREAGWSAGPPLADDALATRTLRIRDDQGRSWFAVLLAASVPGTGERQVMIRVLRESAR